MPKSAKKKKKSKKVTDSSGYAHDLEEFEANVAYLKLIEENQVLTDILEEMPPYDQLQELEEKLQKEDKLGFSTIYEEPTGYYTLKCFLSADYAVDKLLFVKDVEAYRLMRFENARKRVATILYERFVKEEEHGYPPGTSAFEIVRRETQKDAEYSISDPNTRRRGGKSQTAETQSNFRSIHVNSIGVYGQELEHLRATVMAGNAPNNLFDALYREVLQDIKLDAFPRYKQSSFFQRYIRTKWAEVQPVRVTHFQPLRVLGRGGFGIVHACRKSNTGKIYAMKCLHKRMIAKKKALACVVDERNVMCQMNSRFVCSLKYAFQDEQTLYFILDLMMGGDLKFHLQRQKQFDKARARFYAAEILLGLEHIHSKGIVYRDLKLENVLLDSDGHCHVTDLGLAAVAGDKLIKGFAGTPGYTAPEMIRNEKYSYSCDFFSLGVLMFRFLSGVKPFQGKGKEIDKAVRDKAPDFKSDFFDGAARNLLQGLLHKLPSHRLGCDAKQGGIQAVKDHKFFAPIDWGLLEAGYLDPPFIPDPNIVNAADQKAIGGFDTKAFEKVRLNSKFKLACQNFDYVSKPALQEEMVEVLERADENLNFERFAVLPEADNQGKCCVIL